jgi:hypothetical protein
VYVYCYECCGIGVCLSCMSILKGLIVDFGGIIFHCQSMDLGGVDFSILPRRNMLRSSGGLPDGSIFLVKLLELHPLILHAVYPLSLI